MIRLLDKSRVPLFEYFYLLCIIIYAGNASALVRGFGDIRTIGNAIPLILSLVFALYKRISIDKEFWYVVLFFSAYSLLNIISVGSAEGFLWIYSKWIITFYITYVICKGYGYRLFIVAETVLFHLAIIGLIGWILLLVVPVPFTSFIQSISLEPFNDIERFTSANVFVYTIILSSVFGEGSGENYLFVRNCGFAWEPGAFACIICLALCFNAFRTNFRLKNNVPFLVFLAALVSTQSTTGYGTFIIMIGVWLIYNKKFGWLAILIPAYLYVMNLPFMESKLELNAEGFNEASVANANEGEWFSRFLSLKILWEEFLHHPLFGYCYSEPEFLKHGLMTWSGLGRLLAQYGIIVSFLFFYYLVKTTQKINDYFSTQSGFLVIVAVMGSMISYMLWTQPFYMAIWMLFIFAKNQKKNPLSNLSILSKV